MAESTSIESIELWYWQIAWAASNAVTPEEEDLFGEVVDTHYAHHALIGDMPLAFGPAELASAAFVVFQTLLEFVRTSMPTVGGAVLDVAKDGVKALVLEKVKTKPAPSPVQLSAQQLGSIRAAIVAKALRSQYSKAQAEALADAVISSLALRRP